MKKIKYFLGALSLVFALQSCNDLLEQDNPNTVTTAQAVTTLNGINSINQGFYSAIPFGLNITTQTFVTDEVVYPSNNQNQGGGRALYIWEYTPGTVADRDNGRLLWRDFYLSILRNNLVIKSIDNIAVTSPADINLKNLYKAEALGMRAFSHFQLIQTFSPKYNPSALGVPYKTDEDVYELPARLTMAETYAKISEDIEAALTLFNGVTLPSGYGNSRLTKDAVLSLKAKVALELGNYDTVISSAISAIGTRKLVTTEADLVKLWSDASDYEEVIFKISSIAGGATNSVGGSWLYSNGSVQWNVSQTLASKYEASDYRNSLFITKVGNITTTEFVPGKYLLPYASGTKSVFGIGDSKVFRTADLLLMISEAYARKGDLANALVYYKQVRDARNAGASTAFASQANALDQILDERARELAYEGSRLRDLKRFDKTIKRLPADSRNGYTTLEMNDVNLLTFPIPQQEMFNNENMIQNPGY